MNTIIHELREDKTDMYKASEWLFQLKTWQILKVDQKKSTKYNT